MQVRIYESELELAQGDLTECDVEAIVNPANHLLKLGAGVAGAIARKGGPMIQRECDAIGGCSVGNAAITGAGELACKYVIHAVGPKMGEGEEDEKIASATEAALNLASKNGIQSIAIPALSTGVFGVPMDLCAKALLGAIVKRLKEDGAPARVVVVLPDFRALSLFEETLGGLVKK